MLNRHFKEKKERKEKSTDCSERWKLSTWKVVESIPRADCGDKLKMYAEAAFRNIKKTICNHKLTILRGNSYQKVPIDFLEYDTYLKQKNQSKKYSESDLNTVATWTFLLLKAT